MDSVSYTGLKCHHKWKHESFTFKKQLAITPLQHNTSNLIFIASTNRNSEMAHKREQPQRLYSPIVSSSWNYLLFPALLFIGWERTEKTGIKTEASFKIPLIWLSDYFSCIFLIYSIKMYSNLETHWQINLFKTCILWKPEFSIKYNSYYSD